MGFKKRNRQISVFEYPSGFHGVSIDPSNRWVKLSHQMPWDLIEEIYATKFNGPRGNRAYSSRLAFGALFLKQALNVSDADLIELVRENPYLQFFLGFEEFSSELPFDTSLMSYFRQRFTAAEICQINEAIIAQNPLKKPSSNDDSDDDSSSGHSGESDPKDSESSTSSVNDLVQTNSGTLILDATCVPQDIHFPTDIRLLYEAVCSAMRHLEITRGKPITKTQKSLLNRARQAYLSISKSKKNTPAQFREKQGILLKLLKRCLGYFDSPAMNKPTSPKTIDALKTLSLIHDQQFEMWKLKINRIERRIVSVSQPWVRPIKRGKASINTEFGSKIALSTVDGYVRMEYFSFENFNEALTLQESAERYKERTGSYPERILADKIYRNKANLAFCKSKNIRMNGPALGRPPKDPQVRQQQRAAEVQEAGDRNMVEAKIGESKRKYGLDRIMERTQQATEVMICVSFVVMNSFRNLRKQLASFFDKNQVFNFYISFEVYAIAS